VLTQLATKKPVAGPNLGDDDGGRDLHDGVDDGEDGGEVVVLQVGSLGEQEWKRRDLEGGADSPDCLGSCQDPREKANVSDEKETL
jgi:hypothetical protein